VGGAGHAPWPTHPGLALSKPCEDRAGPAHEFDLRFGKASSPPKRAMRISKSSSLSVIRSPTRRLSRLSSRSSAAALGSSASRFKAARPPQRTRPATRTAPPPAGPSSGRAHSGPHPAAGVRYKTTSCLRFADRRFTDPLLMDTSCCYSLTTRRVSGIRDRKSYLSQHLNKYILAQ